jgi:hypothetical protein
LLGHPPTYRVVTPDQEPSEVGVKALDTAPRPADPAARPRAGPAFRDSRVALVRVPAVGILEFPSRDCPLSCRDAARRFETVNGKALFSPDKPIAGGHRRAIFEYRSVTDDHRPAFLVA